MKERNIVLILLIISLLFQLGYLAIYQSPIDLEYGSDSEQYIHLANNILSGKDYALDRRGDVLIQNIPYEKEMEQLTAWRVPGYPLFLSGIFLISNSYIFVYLIQIILTLVMFFMLYKISRHFFGKNSSLIFLMILILTPVYVAYSTQIMSETLGTFLLVSVLYMFLFKKETSWYITLGAFSAYSLLVKVQFLFLIPLLCLFLLYKKNFKKLIFFLAFFLLVFSPWIIRNNVVFDSFIPLSTQSGEGIYFNTLPYQSELGNQGGIHQYLLPYHFSLVNSSRSEVEVSELLTQKAFARMKADPIGVMKNKIENFFFVWIMPYKMKAFDSREYDNYISKITFFGRFLKRGTTGHFIFKHAYWGFWIFVWISGLLFIPFNIKNKKYWIIFILALYPLVLGMTLGFGERALIPFFPFILMLTCALWLKNEKNKDS